MSRSLDLKPGPDSASVKRGFSEISRAWIVRNLQPLAFLVAYFFTIVLGNLFLALPFGEASLKWLALPTAVFRFSTLFSPGYWLLLAMPFVVVPVVVVGVRKLASTWVSRVSSHIPDFRRVDYLVLTSVCFGYVLFSFWQAGALDLAFAGTNALSSVQARFLLLSNLGFAPMATLQSVLVFLSIYSLVRWLKSGEKFWAIVTVVNVALMSVLLIALNMKWPILLFYIGLGLTIFTFSRKRPYLKALVTLVLLCMLFLLISVHVLRAQPTQNVAVPEVGTTQPAPVHSGAAVPSDGETAQPTSQPVPARQSGSSGLLGIPAAAVEYGPRLGLFAVYRMALIYPYYYESYDKQGPLCGGLIAQLRVGPECRPSTYIYTQIFGQDGFQGQGTSPQAVHISAYSLGGWPLAIIALVLASLILALLACMPLTASATIGALAITGALAGYQFSQLPGEGPIFYDHGLFWTLLVIAAYTGLRIVTQRKKLRKAS
ncbi:hypothetical protein [Parafrigoribacterium humi]|uniref:hypothetical protein n=1 Tax=Parafrigoribacterium humi TaxID=3144664 RepID=UPI0032EB2D8E